jgi:hypothetical protein
MNKLDRLYEKVFKRIKKSDDTYDDDIEDTWDCSWCKATRIPKSNTTCTSCGADKFGNYGDPKMKNK